MNYGIVYIVMNDGEVVYASVDEEVARAYAENRWYEARDRVLDDWGNDDPSIEDIVEAGFQAGFDGDYYEVMEVNISGLSEDEDVELLDGIEVEVSEILEKLADSRNDFL